MSHVRVAAAVLALGAGGCAVDESELVPGADGDADTDTESNARHLDCQGEDCQCANGVDDDGDGLADAEDVQCVAPFDDDESSWATGIPGDNEGSTADIECFFDGNSGPGNDEDCPTPNGCDCRGCCELDLDGDGSPERVLLQGVCNVSPTTGAPGADGGECIDGEGCNENLHCIEGSDGESFCSPCEACEWAEEEACEPNPCDPGEVCVGDDPDAACPDANPCLNHDDCEAVGPEFWCQTGCCVEIVF